MPDKKIEARKRFTRTGIELVAGHEYVLTAIGTWNDWFIPCGPVGYRSPNILLKAFEPFRIAPHEPWFALLGSIGELPRGEHYFLIGSQLEGFCPSVDGELFCCPNDLSFMFFNNSGFVSLSVERIR